MTTDTANYSTSHIYSGVECLWENQDSQNAYRIILVVTTFALPFILVTVMYFYIGREVLCFMTNNPRM